jgi:hypothetical protein
MSHMVVVIAGSHATPTTETGPAALPATFASYTDTFASWT